MFFDVQSGPWPFIAIRVAPTGTIGRVIASYLGRRARPDEGTDISDQSPGPRAELRRPSIPTIAMASFRVARDPVLGLSFGLAPCFVAPHRPIRIC